MYKENRFQQVDPTTVNATDLHGRQTVRNPRFLKSDEKAPRLTTDDSGLINHMQRYRIRLTSNKGGGLARVKALHEDADNTGLDKAIVKRISDEIRSYGKNSFGTGISQYAKVTLLADMRLDQKDVDSVIKTLQFEIQLSDGSRRTVPEVAVERTE